MKRALLSGLCLFALFASAAPLLSASNGDDARKILSRKEYRGYRIVNGEEQRIESSSNESSTEERRIRRDSGARGSSGGSSWSSGSSVDGGFLQLMGWIFLAVIGVLIITMLVRWWLDREARAKLSDGEAPDDAPQVPAARPARSPWQHLYDQYNQALAEQDWAQAAILRFKIFWLMQGRTEVLDEDDVRTWRDALALIDADDQRRMLRRQLTMIERISYAAHSPSNAEFQRWNDQMESMTKGGE